MGKEERNMRSNALEVLKDVRIKEYTRIMELYFEGDFELVKSNTRVREILLRRQAAMAALRDSTNLTLVEIGLIMGVNNHATVNHAKKRVVEALILKDPVSKLLCKMYNSICDHIEGYKGRYKTIRSFKEEKSINVSLGEMRQAMQKQIEIKNKVVKERNEVADLLAKTQDKLREARRELEVRDKRVKLMESSFSKDELFEFKRMSEWA